MFIDLGLGRGWPVSRQTACFVSGSQINESDRPRNTCSNISTATFQSTILPKNCITPLADKMPVLAKALLVVVATSLN